MNVRFPLSGGAVIGLLIQFAIVVGLLLGIFFLVRLFIKIKKLEHPKIFKYYFLMIAAIIIMAASWILNIGWLRFILTIFALPVIHTVLFAIINGKAMQKILLSKKIRIYTLLSLLTYIGIYVFLPDGGDVGTLYVFFGILHSGFAAVIAAVICQPIFIAHIIVSILQIVELNNLKKKEKTIQVDTVTDQQ